MATATPADVPLVHRSPARPIYTRVAVTGLGLAALAPITMMVVSAVAGMGFGSELAFLLVVSAIPLVGAVLVWRFGMWAKIVGAVVSVLAGAALFWMAFGLAYPGSFGDFLPGVMLPIGAVMGLVGSIAAAVQSRRGRLSDDATSGERRIILGVLAVVALAAVVSGALDLTGNRVVVASGATTVTMQDFAFGEGSYEASAGQPAQFLVRNDDPFAHDFTIPELDVAVDVLPGAQELVEVTADPGTYRIYCTLHSDTDAETPDPNDMVATLTVR